MPFIIDMDYTYELKGAKRVAINQLGPSLSKRQCTAQVCFRAEPPPPPPADASPEVKKRFRENVMRQPPPCIIFRGTGARISQFEKDSYPPELDVLWQPKAWADRPTVVAWAKKSFKKVIQADIAAGVCDELCDDYLLMQDNLDSQKQPEYQKVLKGECRSDSHFTPEGETDDVQPVDDGLGRLLKVYMGQEEDEWLEDDDNLTKYENNELTASDRRILIALWYCKSYKRAMAMTEVMRKFFVHTGGLLTADGSGDNLLKIESVPAGETFSWEDDALPTTTAAAALAAAAAAAALATADGEEPEPMDVVPEREVERETEDNLIDDEDEDDEDDAPPAPCEAPPGFCITESLPSAEQLAFSKAASLADALVGRHILFKWPVVGWCVGKIVERNMDARYFKMLEDTRTPVNFWIYYEIDQEKVKTVLRLDEYGGDENSSWVLLDPVATDGGAGESSS